MRQKKEGEKKRKKGVDKRGGVWYYKRAPLRGKAFRSGRKERENLEKTIQRQRITNKKFKQTELGKNLAKEGK